MTDETEDDIAAILAEAALAGGAAIEKAVKDGVSVEVKDDGSPCTEADRAAEAAIMAALAAAAPGEPIVSEESAVSGQPVVGTFFVVDPLDGTRDFIAGEADFAVNVAAVADGRPIAGAVFAPRLNRLYLAGRKAFAINVAPGQRLPAKSAWAKIRTRPAPAAGLVALSSRRHGDTESEAFLARLPIQAVQQRASALKFCLVASGEADVYPRFGSTKEWDTAAGEAILTAAGGTVIAPDGAFLTYGHAERGFLNGSFIAFGDPGLAARLVQRS
ncbi:3'(2'),5'-bisphosphate nucleotidase CysQ [Chelatococcus sp. GCM10030263]|uniref:3'(2'),5'-bisphosphate nucleotidase CysQ family protein n=1 Tax=Chelatococcus sp. GCM10030263 TaxID=3273387 RepID=UPI00361553BD